jgi:hypothetical protein
MYSLEYLAECESLIGIFGKPFGDIVGCGYAHSFPIVDAWWNEFVANADSSFDNWPEAAEFDYEIYD